MTIRSKGERKELDSAEEIEARFGAPAEFRRLLDRAAALLNRSQPPRPRKAAGAR